MCTIDTLNNPRHQALYARLTNSPAWRYGNSHTKTAHQLTRYRRRLLRDWYAHVVA